MIVLGVIAAIIMVCILSVVFTRQSNRRKTTIASPDGIQDECYVELGGVLQYIQIRGESKKNPVVLFLHGGPGGSISYCSIYFQQELEKHFTMVHWDQHGCGRSYFNGPRDEIVNTENILADIDQLTDYLRKRFKCDKIIIMGHSCGTLFGCQYIKKHPEKVSAYIGISQCVKVWEANFTAGQEALKRTNPNNKVAIKLKQSLEKLGTANSWSDFDIKDYLAVKIYTQQLSPYKGALSNAKVAWLGLTSPYFTRLDWKWYKINISLKQFCKIEDKLMEECLFDLDLSKQDMKYDVPVFIINGACDTISPPSIAREFFDQMNAKEKQFYVVENAGHNLFMEKTAEFSNKVISWYDKIKVNNL